jgi:hypothetical protein
MNIFLERSQGRLFKIPEDLLTWQSKPKIYQIRDNIYVSAIIQARMVFKILIQPGRTGSETNACLFRADLGHHRSSSSIICLATIKPLGETIVNWHGLYPKWSYGDFPVWPWRRVDVALTCAIELWFGTVAAGECQ